MKIYQAEVTFAVDFGIAGDNNPLDKNDNTLLNDIVEDMHLFAHPNVLSMELRSIKDPWLNSSFAQAPRNNEIVTTLPESPTGANPNARCGRPSASAAAGLVVDLASMKFYRAEVTWVIDFAVDVDDNQNENTVLQDIAADMHTFAHPHALNVEWTSIKGPGPHFSSSQAPQNKTGEEALRQAILTLAQEEHDFGSHSRRCRRRRWDVRRSATTPLRGRPDSYGY